MAVPLPPRVDFDHLPSYKFYEQLTEDTSESINSKYYNGLNDLTTKYPWINDILKKLRRNISLVQNKHDFNDEFIKKGCFDLHYWLHKEVFNHLESKARYSEIKHVITKIQEVWTNVIDTEFSKDDYKCYPDKKLYINMGFLQEIKDLFDFFEDFEVMKKEIIDDTFNSCNKYVEYIRQRIPAYYVWRDQCKVEGSTCKRYIDNYMKYHPASIASELNYFTVILTYAYKPCYNDVYRVFVDGKRRHKRQDALYQEIMEKIELEEAEQDLLSARAADATAGSRLYIKHDKSRLKYYFMWRRIVYLYENVFPYILLVIGAFIIFYIMYKFTPFGRSLLRTRAKVRKKLGPNINYEDIKLLNDSDESLDTNSDESSYQLSYSSSVS
ncbi:VIR protein [Plasmodium vivax]|uniref:VIR protein n=1 Tax=Plasmodium vivax TaxID=5855 RepID=A0A1G4HLK3_PLAVI|nr:VIR protein [Plasmodium vivax]